MKTKLESKSSEKTRELWQKILANFDEESESVEQFSLRQGISSSSVYQWRKRLMASRSPHQGNQVSLPIVRAMKAKSGLRPSSETQNSDICAIAFEMAGARLTFGASVSPIWLAEFLSALVDGGKRTC